MTRGAWLCALGCVLGVVPRCGEAQASDSLFATGVHAYQSLEFDLAAWLLRRHAAQLGDAPAAQRAQTLVYLGAADLFRGRRDSAVAVFRRLVLLDPRYRPDRLVFPPEVTSLFDAVRQQTKVVLVVVPSDTTFAPGPGAYDIWVVASSYQTVEVTLRAEDGTPVRPLYLGPVSDSLKVQWDGFDAAGQPPIDHRLLLRVASRAPTGDLAGIVQTPLDLKLSRPDTLPWPLPPAAADLLPERADGTAAKRALLGGVLLSGAVLVLPAVVGGSDTPSEPRVAVAATIGVASVIGFVVHRPGRPLPENVRANKARHDAWQQRLAAVKQENIRRRREVRMIVRAGEPTAIQPRGS